MRRWYFISPPFPLPVQSILSADKIYIHLLSPFIFALSPRYIFPLPSRETLLKFVKFYHASIHIYIYIYIRKGKRREIVKIYSGGEKGGEERLYEMHNRYFYSDRISIHLLAWIRTDTPSHICLDKELMHPVVSSANGWARQTGNVRHFMRQKCIVFRPNVPIFHLS